MQTYDTDGLRTDCSSMDPEIPPGCSSKQLRSCTFFQHFHPVPRRLARLEALHQAPKNRLT